jgi:hypothetical protein
LFLGSREKTTTSEDSMLLVVCRMKKGLQKNGWKRLRGSSGNSGKITAVSETLRCCWTYWKGVSRFLSMLKMALQKILSDVGFCSL